jgi:hypothetical protein
VVEKTRRFSVGYQGKLRGCNRPHITAYAGRLVESLISFPLSLLARGTTAVGTRAIRTSIAEPQAAKSEV